jgi:hypothetical protein
MGTTHVIYQPLGTNSVTALNSDTCLLPVCQDCIRACSPQERQENHIDATGFLTAKVDGKNIPIDKG